jgi:hypothetical protein
MRTLFLMLSLRRLDSIAATDDKTCLAEKIDPTEMDESDTSDTASACTVIDHGPIEPRRFKCRVKKMRKKVITAMKKLFYGKAVVVGTVDRVLEIRREGIGFLILKVCYNIFLAFGAGIIVGLGVLCALALSGAFAF